MRRTRLVLSLVALGGCALGGPRPGPPPNAPTESDLSAAPAPDVCKVSPGALRRVGPIEAGATPLGEAFERLGRPQGNRTCWVAEGGEGVALFAHGRLADQPIRSLALVDVDAETARPCARTGALGSPLALAAGLRPGMTREEVEGILGSVEPDEGGAFGKECCGLEQVGVNEQGPVYGFACSAVLGALRDGRVVSLAVSRYAPPAQQGR